MAAIVARSSSALRLGAIAGGVLACLIAPLVAVLSVLIGQSTCAGSKVEAAPSSHAERSIPPRYLAQYRQSGGEYGVPWQVLAGIGSIETDHGRLDAPGVRSGVNSFGCCAGPMQFNIRDGSPSTWQRYRVDGNRDGTTNIYDPSDAIASAANYLRALLRNADGNLNQAVFGYYHSQVYVNDVLARARSYARLTESELNVSVGKQAVLAECAGGGLGVPANLRAAERLSSPRALRTLPLWGFSGAPAPQAVDARIYDNVVWILRRYHLRVTAAREAGHQTHGDGTAVDLVPADGTTQGSWDASAGRLAHDLGWTPACARSGTRPACPLAAAIQFIGYDGYPGHGSPRSCTGRCAAHIHLSWASPCYGSADLVSPCRWVMAFPSYQQPTTRGAAVRPVRSPVALNDPLAATAKGGGGERAGDEHQHAVDSANRGGGCAESLGCERGGDGEVA